MTLYGYAKVSVREPKAATSSGVTGRSGTARAWAHSWKDRQADVICDSGVGGNAVVEGVLNALAVLVGEAGGHVGHRVDKVWLWG